MQTNDDEMGADLRGATAQELKSFIERIENLEEEKAEVAANIKEVYSEAKGRGFDTKVLRAVIARRKKDAGAVAEFETILQLYLEALGM